MAKKPTQRFAETGCAVETPKLSEMSIEALNWLHRAAIAAGDIVEGLGWKTNNQQAKDILLGLSDCFASLQNEVVDEMALRKPADDAERRHRTFVLLDDAGRCLDPDEYPTELAELVGRL
jgi:hypothetical protein